MACKSSFSNKYWRAFHSEAGKRLKGLCSTIRVHNYGSKGLKSIERTIWNQIENDQEPIRVFLSSCKLLLESFLFYCFRYRVCLGPKEFSKMLRTRLKWTLDKISIVRGFLDTNICEKSYNFQKYEIICR